MKLIKTYEEFKFSEQQSGSETEVIDPNRKEDDSVEQKQPETPSSPNREDNIQKPGNETIVQIENWKVY